MFENLEIRPMFEDQVHERHQFTLTIDGTYYQGLHTPPPNRVLF